MGLWLLLCSAEQAREKYRNSSCYFVGPVLATPMNKSAVFAATLALAVGEATVENPWSLGAVLGGIQVWPDVSGSKLVCVSTCLPGWDWQRVQ